MNRKILKLMFLWMITVAMLSGCSSLSKDTIIPEDIINNALSAYDDSKSYYSESVLNMYEKGELIEKSTMKEWTDSSEGILKKRVESESDDSGRVISTNNGKEILIYMEKDNKAMKMTVGNGIDGSMGDYKEQFLRGLSLISKSHELIYSGEEKVDDFETIHLHAKAKKDNSIIGDIDYWIDKDTWFLVKTRSETGDNKLEMKYGNLEFADKFDDSLFTQIIPEGVEIENLDENLGFEENEITIEEAEEIVGKPILLIKNDSEYSLKSITEFSYGSNGRAEINQNYEKNEMDAFILTAIVDKDQVKDKEDVISDEDMKLPGEEDALIRGGKGSIIEDIIRCINWEEDEINYSLLILNPSVTIEEAINLVENMEVSK